MSGFRWAAGIGFILLAASPGLAAPVSRPPGALSCIDSQHVDGRRAEDESTVLFTVGSRTYRNHLRTVCPGLMRLNDFGSLETESYGSQLCEGDTIRVFDSTSARAVGIGAFPRCVLGWFEPVPAPPKRSGHPG